MRLLHSDPQCCCNYVISVPSGLLVCCLTCVLNPSIHDTWYHMDEQTCCLQWLYYRPVFKSYPRVFLNRKALGLTRICDLSELCPVDSVQEISTNKSDLTAALSVISIRGYPVMERVRLSQVCAVSCCANDRKVTLYYLNHCAHGQITIQGSQMYACYRKTKAINRTSDFVPLSLRSRWTKNNLNGKVIEGNDKLALNFCQM